MKKILAVIFCFLLLAVYGCGNIDDTSEPDNMPANNSSEEPESSNAGQDLKYICERLSSVSYDYLVSEFEKADSSATYVEPLICNTPGKVYFRYADKKNYESYILAWDKKSGNVTYACPNQFCEHSDCIFASSHLDFMLYYNGGLLICGRTEDGRQTLYTADANGENETTIFETKHTLSLLGVAVRGEEVYVLLPEKNPAGEVIYRINEIKEGKAYPISPKDVDISQFAVTENGIYCVYAESSLLVYTGDIFETTAEIAEKVMHFNVTEEHLIYNTLDHETFCDGEYLMAYNGDMQLVGDMLYFISEEDENELRRINVTDGTEEHVMFFKTDGVDDEYNDYLVDPLGFVYTMASTYKDILNNGGSRNAEEHFMIYDTEDGDIEERDFVFR